MLISTAAAAAAAAVAVDAAVSPLSTTISSEWLAWLTCRQPLCALQVDVTGTIEEAPPPAVQVDFANASVGGGVLGHGCVQEEIRFVLSPELIVRFLL
jgi:hypothetical protein